MEKRALTALPDIFSVGKDRKKQDQEKLIGELYRQIGQLKVENDWLKKILVKLTSDRRQLILKHLGKILVFSLHS